MFAKKNTTIVVKKMPLVLNRKYNCRKFGGLSTKVQNVFVDDVIYEGELDFLKHKILLFNRLNRLNNTSRTIAKYYIGADVIEKTSDKVTNLIGQNNYDTLFTALCSVINQELRIKSILAVLTSMNEDDKLSNIHKTYSDAETQTHPDDKYILKRYRNKRKIIMPYIVKDVDKTNNIILKNKDNTVPEDNTDKKLQTYVAPDNREIKEETIHIKVETELADKSSHENRKQNNIVDREHVDRCNENVLTNEENSNDSLGNISLCSITTNNSQFNDLTLLDNIDKHIEEGYVIDIGGNYIKLKTKPEDNFHIATDDNLKDLNITEQKQLMLYQACVDFKNCLNRDEDGNIPLHLAVMNDDIKMVKRHAAMLKIKNESVDLPATGNFTALKMAVLKDFSRIVTVLLQAGADPLQVDEDYRTPLHHAVESSKNTVLALVKYCEMNARKILQENEELWKESYNSMTDDLLAKCLLDSMCSLCDNQGYTPLMLASQLGKFENVKILADVGPSSVNKKMPTSGNTALYLAVAAAYEDATERGNKANISDNYKATIHILLENGANTSLENYVGGSLDMLLTELNIKELSMLVVDKLTSLRYFEGKPPKAKCDAIMLVKNDTGGVNVMELETKACKRNVYQHEQAKSVNLNNIDLNVKSTDKETEAKNETINSQSNNYTIKSPSVNGHKLSEKQTFQNVYYGYAKVEGNTTFIRPKRCLVINPTAKKIEIQNPNAINNLKNPPIKIIDPKDIKIINNGKFYKIDKLNLNNSVTLSQIPKSSVNIVIPNNKNTSTHVANIKKQTDNSTSNRPIILESIVINSPNKSNVTKNIDSLENIERKRKMETNNHISKIIKMDNN